MELKTKEIGRVLEIEDKDCTVIIWTRPVQLGILQFPAIGSDAEHEEVDDKNFKEGEQTLVKNIGDMGESVDMDFMDGTSCLCVMKNSFEVPLCLKGEKEGDIIHNNVPKWVR